MDLGEPTHTTVLCWMPKPLPNECTGWFARAIKRLWDFLRKTKYCCVVEENIKVVKLFFFKEPHNIHPIVLSSFGKQTHTHTHTRINTKELCMKIMR